MAIRQLDEESARSATLVLVHGAGDTSRVWEAVQSHLRHPSIALDLAGRISRPFDITQVTLEVAASMAADDVQAYGPGPFIIVGHSSGGMLAPSLAGRLGSQARHLVLIAGLIAPHGQTVVDVLFPEKRKDFESQLETLRRQYGNHVYERGITTEARGPFGLAVFSDPRVAQQVESLNLMLQPVSWTGVRPDMPRTWIRPDGDPIQTPEMQRRLIEAFLANEVIDIVADHTPARSNPRVVAGLLDEIAERYDPFPQIG